ncbi:hypothetical protein ACSBR2_028549 [Camellia fascicularis]
MDAKALFRLFKKFGVVKDVYIPFKRRKVTNSRFGFVKFDREVASNIAVQKANGLWVDDRSLQMKTAAYDRGKREEPRRRRPQIDASLPDVQRNNGRGTELEQRSFAEVLKGNTNMAVGKTSLTVNVNEDGHGWLLESVILRLKTESSVHSIQKVLNDKGMDQTMVFEEEGMFVLTFKSQEIVKENFGLIKE